MATTAIPVPNSGEVVASSWGKAVADAHNGIQSGTGNLVWSGSAVSATLRVTFPRPFAAPPVVVALGQINMALGWATAVPDATGFTIQGREVREQASSATLPFFWVAIGIPA